MPVSTRRDRPTTAHPGESRDPSGPSTSRDQVIEFEIKVAPDRIHRLDQLDLPAAFPFLDLAPAPKGAFASFIELEPDQLGHIVLGGETGTGLGLMVQNPLRQVVGAAGVERAVRTARENVGVENLSPARLRFSLGPGFRRDERGIGQRSSLSRFRSGLRRPAETAGAVSAFLSDGRRRAA